MRLSLKTLVPILHHRTNPMSQNASSPPLIVDSAAMTEDDLYRENVNRLMQARSTEIISNGLPRHAAALFECFFRNALSEVKIVCSNLQREVFDAPDVLSSFASAARRGVSIQILVQNAPAEGSEFVKLFSQLRDADHGSLCIETEAATKSPMANSLTRLLRTCSDRLRIERTSDP